MFRPLRGLASFVVVFYCLTVPVAPALGQVEKGVQVGPALPDDPGDPQPNSQGNLIDFDDIVGHCQFSSSSPLSDEYAEQGVIFVGPTENDGGAILGECSGFNVTGHSPPNFLAFNVNAQFASGGVPRGPESIVFLSPVSQVTIKAGVGSGGGFAAMDCFISQGFVGSDSVQLDHELQPLTVSAPVIEGCLLSFTGTTAAFDDLQFNFTPGAVHNLLVRPGLANNLSISYTPACQGLDHTLVSGPLDQVSDYAYDDQECGIGTSGTHMFDAGPGSRFFLVVANDGGTVEGSYGLSSDGERPEDLNDPNCPLTQDLGQACEF